MTDSQPRLTGHDARSADRALNVLDALALRAQSASATWIARACDIPRSSVYPILAVLLKHGMVKHDASRRMWALGPRLLEFGDVRPTLEECVAVLDAFGRRSSQMDPGEIARRTKFDLVRVTGALTALEQEGLVFRTGDGRFALGLRLAARAARIGPVERLRTAARPGLVTLRDQTGETANLLARDGDRVLYLDQVESERELRHSGWVGRSVPLAGTAVGAALLDGHGVHVAVDAVEIGVTAVATRIPIDGLAAVVSVTGPSARLREANLDLARRQVAATARLIRDALRL
jgi:IclR family acetate operon transcriptional repressor